MTRRLPGDWIFAVCAVLGALLYLYADARMPVSGMAGQVSPRVFPALVGGGVLLSGVLYLIENLKSLSATKSAGQADPEAPRHRLTLLATLAWTAAYYVAFEPAGYLIATAVFIYGLLAFFHRGRWIINLLIALCFTVIVYALFSKFLHVGLPRGLLSF